MEITNNNLLNILLPNDNKVIKEALKQADLNQLADSSKNRSVQHILANFFNDLTQGTKSNETIVNLLKNANIFKELTPFSKEIQSLSELIKNEPKLNTFQSKLDNFMLNITQLDENNLKTQINNSGIFLESKLNTALGNLSQTITSTLLELKQALLNTPNVDSSNALKLIDSILSQANSSNPTKMFVELKELLTTLKNMMANLEIPNNQTNNIVQSIQKLETLFNKEILNNPSLINASNQNIKPEVANELKSIFSQLQTYFNATNTQANKELTALLDKLIQTQNMAQNPNFIHDSKMLLTELKQLPQMQAAMAYNLQSNHVTVLTTQLENIINKLSFEQAQTLNTPTIKNTPLLPMDVAQNVKNILNELQKALSTFSSTHTNTASLMQQIDQILLPQNFSSPQTLLNNLQQLLTQLHTTEPFGSALNNSAQTKELINIINRFETIVTKEVLNNPLFNAPQNIPNLLKEDISHDMKAVLLQLQKEVSSGVQTQNTQEMLKTIDRLLVQIDYNQLLSLTSHTNTLYLPFLWDLLEEGTISTAKTNKEKFYCQINLKLKEHGKLDLLVAVYDDNIEITMYAQQEAFKKQLQSNLSLLRKNLSSVGLTPLSIQLYDLKESNEHPKAKEEFSFVNEYAKDLDFGINIRV